MGLSWFWRNLYWQIFDRKELKKNALPHVKGTTAVQFILTSNIIIHALDDLGHLYFNLFSCDDIPAGKVQDFVVKYFGGAIVNRKFTQRK